MNSVYELGNIKGAATFNGDILSFTLEVEERIKKGDSWEATLIPIPVVVTGKRVEGLKKCDLGEGSRLLIEGKIAIGKGPYVLARQVTLLGKKCDASAGAAPSGDDIPF